MIVDIDHCGTYFSGAGIVFDDAGLPGSFISFKTANCDTIQSFEKLSILPLDPETGNLTSIDLLKRRYADLGQELHFPNQVELDLRLNGDELSLQWKTDIGSSGEALLPRSQAGLASQIAPQADVSNWLQFKAAVSLMERDRFIFLGQPSDWRLRTAFHRTRRKDVLRFTVEDIPRLH